MIYSIVIKKQQGDRAPFIHVQLLQSIIRNTANPFIVGWPGYLGNTVKTIDDFYDGINPYPNRQLNGFFFQPLVVVNMGGYLTNEAYMNQRFGGHFLPQPRLLDHSKILAILDVNQVNNQHLDVSVSLGNYDVKAILIGSSSQSFNTYFRNPTPKGEADVLLVKTNRVLDINGQVPDRRLLMEVLGEENVAWLFENENVVIAREIEGAERDLNNIFRRLSDDGR